MTPKPLFEHHPAGTCPLFADGMEHWWIVCPFCTALRFLVRATDIRKGYDEGLGHLDYVVNCPGCQMEIDLPADQLSDAVKQAADWVKPAGQQDAQHQTETLSA